MEDIPRYTLMHISTKGAKNEGFKLPTSDSWPDLTGAPWSSESSSQIRYLKKPWMNGLNHLKVLLEEESHKKQIG